jgi:cellulose synthase/poly-beta-1,6-N-acetylglucosamine synthase-like glycosyltransferase
MIYTILEIKAVVLICIAIYVFALYPFVLKFLAKYFSKPVKKDINFQPALTVLIAAYNEENYIEDCILSLENCDYPKDKFNIFVGIDGATDNTDKVIQELQTKYQNINYWIFERGGKNLVINKLLEKVETDYVVFMDADIRIRKNSLMNLSSYLVDETVGGVMATLNIVEKGIINDNAGRDGETFYQKMETVIRDNESKIFGNTNALGTLYIVKKSNLTSQPNDKVCDDFFNVIFTAKCKKRFIFDKTTVVDEIREKSLSAELKRRVRMVAGGLATIQANWQLLLPNYGWSSFFLWSHKLLRYLSPLILIYLLVVAIILPEESFLKYPLIYLQGIFYLMGFLGYIFDKLKIKIKLFRLALFVLIMNVGFLFGIIRFLFGGQNSKWEKIG